MIVRGGIDEAGFGPLLGPLCIGYAFFAVPPDGSPRSLLRSACAPGPARGERRVVVCDSKTLHRGPRKLAALERTALAFHAAARGGRLPATIGEVLRTGITDRNVLDAHPWYRDLDVPLPLAVERGEAERCAERLMDAAARAGVRILDLGTRVVPEGELNRLFERTSNKSLALFESILPVLDRARSFASQRPVVVCDRHGGRMSYAPLLAGAFPGAWVAIARQSRRESLYRVRTPEGTVRIAFAEKGESRSFACALASCLAKYARELAMNRWNAYFSRIAPRVRPTAGYVTDARRYLREAAGALQEARLEEASFLRCR